MTTLSSYHNVFNANSFVNHVKGSNNAFYLFAASQDKTTLASANQFADGLNSIFYRDALFGQRLSSSDIILMAKKNVWTSNTVYDQYDQTDPDLYTNSLYYVVTDENNVYKCISNNKGSASVYKPRATIVNNNFTTQDGYVWKYLFTISSSNDSKFSFGNTYFPVEANNSVLAAAVPGTIDYVEISNVGYNYSYYNSGQLQSLTNPNTVVVSTNASSVTGAYVNSSLYIRGVYGSDQVRKITYYDGTTKTIQLQTPLDIFELITLNKTQGSIVKNLNLRQTYTTVNISNGSVQVGSVVQQSPANTASACGTIIATNSTSAVIELLSSSNFTNNIPIAISPSSSWSASGNTVSGNTSCTAIVGVGTSFSSTFSSGDYIRIQTSGEFRRIVSVANDTSLTVSSLFTNTFSSNTYAVIKGNLGITADITTVSQTTAVGNIAYTSSTVKTLVLSNSNNTISIGNILLQSNTSNNIIATGTVIFSNSSVIKVDSGNFTNASPANTTLYTTTGLQTVLNRVLTDDVYATVKSNTAPFYINGKAYCYDPSTSLVYGNGVITSVITTPGTYTNYIISPTVTANGDGSGFVAYSTIDTSSNTISGVNIINRGTGYSHADILLDSGVSGAGAVLKAYVSPAYGHGGNIYDEVSATYVGISASLSNTTSQGGILPLVGNYNTFGIVKNPLFANTWAHVNLTTTSITTNAALSNTYIGGLVSQSNTSGWIAYGVINGVSGNVAYVTSINGSNTQFKSNTATINISTGYSNVNIISVTNTVFTAANTLNQYNAGKSYIQAASVGGNNNILQLSNTMGVFTTTANVYSANVYGTLITLKKYNNTTNTDLSTFTQLLRFPLVSNTSNFTINSTVQLIKNYGSDNIVLGTAKIYAGNTELDITHSGSAYNIGEYVSSNTSANGLVVFSNTTYTRLSSLQGSISIGANVYNSTANNTVTNTYNVVLLSRVEGDWSNTSGTTLVSSDNIIGSPLGQNYILYPDLVKSSGDVIYIENTSDKISRNRNSNDTVKLIFKF